MNTKSGETNVLASVVLAVSLVVGVLLTLIGLSSALETVAMFKRIGVSFALNEAAPSLLVVAAGIVTIGVGIVASRVMQRAR